MSREWLYTNKSPTTTKTMNEIGQVEMRLKENNSFKKTQKSSSMTETLKSFLGSNGKVRIRAHDALPGPVVRATAKAHFRPKKYKKQHSEEMSVLFLWNSSQLSLS